MSIATEDRGVPPFNRYKNAPRKSDFTIEQDWASYSAAEHDRWDRLFARSQAILRDRACDEFLAALHALELSKGGIPDMAKLSDRLQRITGWRVVPVTDLVPDDIFFDHLANRRFPAGAFIRPEQQLDYLEEPDVFHDVFGHVPLLANKTYADFMQAYGNGGRRAMKLGRLANLARLYWYTVEFGLIRSQAGLRLFGAGIMSSAAESVFALEVRRPIASRSISNASCARNTSSTIFSRPISSSTASSGLLGCLLPGFRPALRAACDGERHRGR